MTSGAANSGITSAAEMARLRNICPKAFRAALRRERLAWHMQNGSWEVRIGSREHADLQRVLSSLLTGTRPQSREQSTHSPAIRPAGGRIASDEAWIIGLCDEVLGTTGLRQHRFPFLLGDPGQSGRRMALPVDAYYPTLGLVIEYYERQHTERVGLFDDKLTVSGMPRGEQRRRYDALRRTVLPENGLKLVIFDYSEFGHSRGRLVRSGQDREIIAGRLGKALS